MRGIFWEKGVNPAMYAGQISAGRATMTEAAADAEHRRGRKGAQLHGGEDQQGRGRLHDQSAEGIS